MNLALRIALPLVIAYASTLVWVWNMWWFDDSYYQHGPLLVAMAAWGVWDRRQRWRALPFAPSGRGWWVLGLALLLHLAGVALTIDSLSAASLVLAVPGAVWVATGGARTAENLSALLAVGFAVPPPLRVTGEVVFRLKELAIDLALRFTNAFGAGDSGEVVVRDGFQLRVLTGDPDNPHVWLRVADECGGLRSLLALTAVGYCLAFMFGPRRGARPWVLLVLAGPVAILANVLRVSGLCWAARWQWDANTSHDVMNIVEWVFALGLLIAVDLLFLRRNSMGGKP